MSLSDGVARSGWTNLYSRTVGGIQVLYASFFGWLAFLGLRWSAQQMIWIAQDGFSFQGTTFKGLYLPALDLENLAEGTVLALLSLQNTSEALRWKSEFHGRSIASTRLVGSVAVSGTSGRDSQG